MIETLLHSSEPDIISITEHWLKKDEVEATCIQGYVVADSFCREKYKNGGTIIYTKIGLTITPLHRITMLNVEKHFEVSAATIEGPDGKTTIVTLYRSPTGDLKIFMENLTTALEIISHQKHRILVGGDFNLNFLERGPNQQALTDIFSSFNLHMLINKPTRITHHSRTCIDNIFSNIDKDQVTTTITDSGISDHCTLTLKVRVLAGNKAKYTYVETRRTLNEKQKNIFTLKLSNTNWDPILQESSVDEKFDAFMKMFTALFEETFPARKIKIRTSQKRKLEWYTPELQTLSADVWNAYQESKHNTDEDQKRNYLRLKRHYVTSLDTAQSNHNNKAIKNSSNKQKTAWRIIRSNQNSHMKGEGKQEVHINDNNRIITSQTEVANLLNNYFRDQVENLISRRTNDILDGHKKTYGRVTNKVIFLAPIAPKEYFEIINKVSKKKSAGIDEIPGTLLKDIAVYIREPLTDIANATFSQGCFPKNLKHALIIPMFKKGDRTKLENYRQISLLSVFSKFLETAFCTRIVGFLEKNNLLNPRQHGFTKKRSTTTAVTNFICEVHEALDNKNNAIGIFYDYSKAFDTINHRILLEKLESMGIAGNAKNWIKTYLQDRTQTVALRGPSGTALSEETKMNVGLPQGSTISPTLFTLFTADLATHANVGSLTLYADDTTQLITDAQINKSDAEQQISLSQQGSTAVQQMQDYCIEDGLFINRMKTVMLHFKPPRHNHNYSPLIKIDKKTIPEQEEISFLGVKLENTLEWKSHIESLSKKIASDCYLLRKIKSVTSPEVVKMLYFSQIEAKLRYCITLWGNSHYVRRLFILQKRCIRTMAGAKNNPCAEVYIKDSCKPLFRKFQILTLPSLYIFCSIMFIKENPALLTTNGAYHRHNTRNKNEPRLQKHTRESFKKNPIYAGSKLLNALPIQIKEKEGSSFKENLKLYLIEKCYYNVKDFYT
jgi:hypothetical protein